MATWKQQINQNITKPKSISGLANGQFPSSALIGISNGEGHHIGSLCPEAARSWTAMVAVALKDGVDLDATDSYRPLQVQKDIFADRYRTTNQGNGSRVCGGRTWYLRKGKATAACPGTSNHGLGLAIDNRFHGAGLAWLEKHAITFGWQWEVSTENWHIHYMPGDNIPQAVLDYERGTHAPSHNGDDDDMASFLATSKQAGDNKLYLVRGDRSSKWHIPNPDVLAGLTWENAHGPNPGFLSDTDIHDYGKVFLDSIPTLE